MGSGRSAITNAPGTTAQRHWLRRRRARVDGEDPRLAGSHVAAEAHPHEHGEECGHPAVEHEDHTDYLHDGHLHAAHGPHYDEH